MITNQFLLRLLFKNIGFEMPMNTVFLPWYFTCEGKRIRECQEQFHFIKIYKGFLLLTNQGLPRWISGKESVCPPLQEMQETWIRSLGQEDTLKKEMGSTPVFWHGESHGQSSLAGYSPWGCKESDMTEQLTLI